MKALVVILLIAVVGIGILFGWSKIEADRQARVREKYDSEVKQWMDKTAQAVRDQSATQAETIRTLNALGKLIEMRSIPTDARKGIVDKGGNGMTTTEREEIDQGIKEAEKRASKIEDPEARAKVENATRTAKEIAKDPYGYLKDEKNREQVGKQVKELTDELEKSKREIERLEKERKDKSNEIEELKRKQSRTPEEEARLKKLEEEKKKLEEDLKKEKEKSNTIRIVLAILKALLNIAAILCFAFGAPEAGLALLAIASAIPAEVGDGKPGSYPPAGDDGTGIPESPTPPSTQSVPTPDVPPKKAEDGGGNIPSIGGDSELRLDGKDVTYRKRGTAEWKFWMAVNDEAAQKIKDGRAHLIEQLDDVRRLWLQFPSDGDKYWLIEVDKEGRGDVTVKSVPKDSIPKK